MQQQLKFFVGMFAPDTLASWLNAYHTPRLTLGSVTEHDPDEVGLAIIDKMKRHENFNAKIASRYVVVTISALVSPFDSVPLHHPNRCFQHRRVLQDSCEIDH
jgi:hypothetical protein